MTWHPIETAVKDETELLQAILLFDPYRRRTVSTVDGDDIVLADCIMVGWWRRGRWELAQYETFKCYPTHWKPLPEDPERP